MKTCQICGASAPGDAATCAACGEGSFDEQATPQASADIGDPLFPDDVAADTGEAVGTDTKSQRRKR